MSKEPDFFDQVRSAVLQELESKREQMHQGFAEAHAQLKEDFIEMLRRELNKTINAGLRK
jgi:hypothetical protein